MYPIHSMTDKDEGPSTKDEDRQLPFDLAATTIEQLMSEVLPQKLDSLAQHNRNIQQACISHDPTKANQEIIRASLLVKQIERELDNLDKLKQRLKKSDHPAFDKMVNSNVKKASKMLQDFYGLKARQRSIVTEDKEEQEVVGNNSLQLQVIQHHTDLEEAEAYAKSLEDVQKDCVFIHETYTMLSQYVAESAEKVDQIEENTIATEEDVKKAERHLSYCAKKNLAFYPLIGAAVGVCVGGPIGLLVGAKVAVAAALGGGVLGVQSARAIKKKKIEDLQAIDAKVKESESCNSGSDGTCNA